MLRSELSERLQGDDWSAGDNLPGSRSNLTGFVHSLGNRFEATAEVNLAVGLPDRPPVSISGLWVGVAYGPLRELWPLLGGRFSLALRASQVGPSRVIDLEEEGDAVSYRAVMRDASFRGEFPRLRSILARVGEPSHYLLELAQPPAR